jgi:hypothetical protein
VAWAAWTFDFLGREGFSAFAPAYTGTSLCRRQSKVASRKVANESPASDRGAFLNRRRCAPAACGDRLIPELDRVLQGSSVPMDMRGAPCHVGYLFLRSAGIPFVKSLCLALTLACATLAGTVASASTLPLPTGITTVPLAIVTNDRDTSVSRLELMVNDAATVSGIYMETDASATSDPAKAKSMVYPLAGIESIDGVALGQGQGVKAIYLQGTIASAEGQGKLVIRYLANGVFRHFKECRIDLKRVGPHDWQLVNAYDGQPIEQIQVKTWALGISTLGNVCPVTKA